MTRGPDWLSRDWWVAQWRNVVRGALHRRQWEAEMREEFRHHVAARADDLVRRGVPPDVATRRAQQEFGHQDTHRQHVRETTRLASIARLRFSWLDVKLGLRMLPKYPMLNFAAVFALAIGIPVGLAPSHLARSLEAPLPGDVDNRVRAIRYWDPLSSSVAATWDADFASWSQALRSFSAIGAFRSSTYNVTIGSESASPVNGAQLSPSVFGLLRVRPIVGRALTDADFAPDASDVVVIGHAIWSSRFAEDPGVLGERIRIGARSFEIVGVMPDGFAFPSNESFWIPLRTSSVAGASERVRVQVIGRLADDVTAQQAQAELSAYSPVDIVDAGRINEDAQRARLRAEVVPFGLLYLSLPAGGLASLPEYRYVQALMFALLLVACGNVAMLVFARTATRLRELAIRTALGASRTRIVSQIFVETLVLAVIAAGVGVFSFDWALRHVNIAALAGESALPYWLSLGLTRETALIALVLAAVSATVAGVLPALVITGRSIALQIRGGSRIRFGRITGALVVADIAVSVAAVGMAFSIYQHATDIGAADRAAGIVASEYLAVDFRLPERLSGSATLDGGEGRSRSERAIIQRDLVAALEREPGVTGVAIGDALPRMEHRSRPFQLESADASDNSRLRWMRVAQVDPGYFDALGAPVAVGRNFTREDAEGTAHVAIVNTAFVQRTLGGQDALGKRIRFPSPANADSAVWYEIIGVVKHLGVNIVNPDNGDAVYLPAAPGSINPLRVAIHTQANPISMIGRVRAIASSVDPDLVMGNAVVLSSVRQSDWYLVMGVAAGLIVLVGVLVALSTSGLYAMLSLSVTQRTHEVGVRAALGATKQSLLLTVLRRSLVQIALGALIGLPLAARFVFEVSGQSSSGGSVSQSIALALGLSLTVVLVVGVASCVVPARRILRIEASEAMRAEG